jgi:hypothetical protein
MIKVNIEVYNNKYGLNCRHLGIYDISKTLDQLMFSFEESVKLYNEVVHTNYKINDFLFNIKNLKRNRSKND